MLKPAALVTFSVLLSCGTAFAQNGPCSSPSSKLACVIPEEYGSTAFNFKGVLYPDAGHPTHFGSDFQTTLQPLTADIGRQPNLLPLASPSSGIVFTYDSSLKTFVTGTDSLGPILGERAETVGRHRLFVGFSYQYFDFDKIDGVDLHNIPNVLTHRVDTFDNTPNAGIGPPVVTCSPSITASPAENTMGCAFVRDLIKTENSINLNVSQYTVYLTFGITRRIDVSMVIPIENVQMSLTSQDTIVPGTNGFFTPNPGSPDDSVLNQNDPSEHGAPYFFHLFKDCPNTSPSVGLSGLAANCLNHTFPDPAWTGSSSSSPNNSASGIGDVVGRVKWNAWEGERAGFAGGLDVRFPSGDALNYLGSGSYGVRPFAVFSYRARISPHVLVGYEWNTDSVTAGDLSTGVKGKVPNDFIYTVGADARVTKWLTGDFDIVGQRVFGTETVSITSQQFLANCGGTSTSTTACNSDPTPNTVTLPSLANNSNVSYNITNASMGVKVRPIPKVSRLVVTANVLVRLDHGGLESKPVPLVGLGYTF